MTTSPSAKERAQEAASTASEEGKHVAGVAQQEARNVASEAASQARSVLDEAVSQVNSQSKEQKDRLAGTLQTLGSDLESMASQAQPGLATDLARQASSYVRTVSDRLQSREPGELLDDVRRFARQRPGTFLLGALAAGVVVGRLVRGTADGIAAAQMQQGTTGTGTPTGLGTPPTTGPTGTQLSAPVGGYVAAAPTTPAGGEFATTGEAPYPGAPAGSPYDPDPRATGGDPHGRATGEELR